MDETDRRTLLLASTPVVAAAGFAARPYVSDFTDNAVVAAAISEQTGRWLVAAIVMVIGAGMLAFALPAAVDRLGAGRRYGGWVRAAVTIGVVGFVLQVGVDGLGAVAAERSGADVAAFLDASPGGVVIGLSLVALLAAWVGVARAAWTSSLAATTTWVVVIGAAVGALGHAYPSSVGEYIASAGTAVALWTLAAHRPRTADAA